ncbi:HD domain-containing protein [Yinghuangia soli]|uniref:HD domain-containing protein n=1 Tax=Yinghuangia soli TaxID=2908204 RepID=A0AA41PXM1_9ACTN|nr:HD domain-containing protein [Yinghuangia soli]MCF2527240.1 HD domain-containing protein [Yinghuangia soli]
MSNSSSTASATSGASTTAPVPSEIGGIKVPDSRIAAETTELVRDVAGELLFHHSRRVYLFGAWQGARRGLAFDPELLYVGAMFHDLGLVDPYRTTARRFELDGAEAAAAFLRGHGVPADSVRLVWEGIALHTTPEIPYGMAPEVALVTAGVELDVLGIGYADLPDDVRAAVVAAHPRPDFKRRILAAFTDGIKDRPATTFGNVKADVLARFVPGFERGDFVDVIEGSDWAE